ncbi:MAG: hypothetical protein ABSA14_16075 [Acidimicrobiales bacterium]
MTEAVEPNFDHLSRMTTSDRCRREDAFRRFHICHDKLVALSYIGSERATRRVVVLKKAFPAGRRKVFPGVIAPSPIRREIGGSSTCHIEPGPCSPVCAPASPLGRFLPPARHDVGELGMASVARGQARRGRARHGVGGTGPGATEAS